MALVEQKSCPRQRPTGDEALLLIEVSNASPANNRSERASVSAEAGIRDDWSVNVRDGVAEVYRRPIGNSFGEKITVGNTAEVTPLLLPEVLRTAGNLSGDR